MKALSLVQPWATLVAIGAKRIETRSWSTSYRGPIAIHASKSFPGDVQCLVREMPYRKYLEQAGFGQPWQLPRGQVIATCRLVDVLPTCRGAEPCPAWMPSQDSDEWRFGEYSDRRFGWILEDVKILAEPVAAKGSLGLWEWAGQ